MFLYIEEIRKKYGKNCKKGKKQSNVDKFHASSHFLHGTAMPLQHIHVCAYKPKQNIDLVLFILYADCRELR